MSGIRLPIVSSLPWMTDIEAATMPVDDFRVGVCMTTLFSMLQNVNRFVTRTGCCSRAARESNSLQT
jgi:hypothetical protein